MCVRQIASHVTPLIQKLTADKMLAVSVVKLVTTIVVAAVTFQTGAMIVFDSLQPKPSFLREDNLGNRGNKSSVLPTIVLRPLILIAWRKRIGWMTR